MQSTSDRAGAARPARAGLLLAGAAAVAWFALAGDRDPPPPATTLLAGATNPAASAGHSTDVTAAARVGFEKPAAPRAGARRVAVEVVLPPLADSGGDLPMQLRLRGGAAYQGWLDVAFDAGVLTLADASTPYETPEPGVARLHVASVDAQPVIVSLLFSSSPGASATTTVFVRGGQLATGPDQPATLELPAPLQIGLQRMEVAAGQR